MCISIQKSEGPRRVVSKGWFWRMSPRTKTGTRVRSDVPPEQKTGTRVRSHVLPERKPERGYIRQNHPFTKPPFYLPLKKLQIGGRQSHFGGCQFIFWRVPIYILEAEIVLGLLYRKGVIPKTGGILASREPSLRPQHIINSGFLKRASAQTCLRAWYQVRFLRRIFGYSWGLVYGEGGHPWYSTSAQPESHFTCSSPRCAPRVVPSIFFLNYFWAFLGAWGGARGRPWYGTFAKPTGHFTEGMFEKC